MIRSALAFALLVTLAIPAAATAAPPGVGKISVLRRERTSLVLEVSVDPNGSATTVHINFGDTPALGGSTSMAKVGTDTPRTLVSISLTKLKPGGTYYFRAVATNADGTTRGPLGSASTSKTRRARVLKGSEVSFAISTGRSGLYPWRLLAMRMPIGVPVGTNVSLRCRRACHGGAATKAAAGRRQLRFGSGISVTRRSVLELRETKTGYIGRVRRFVFRRNGSLLEAIRTLSRCLNGSRVVKCPKS